VLSNISYPGINGYDLASWTIPAGNSSTSNKTQTLVFAVNFNYGPNDAGPTWAPAFSLLNVTGTVSQVLFGNVSKAEDGTAVFQMNRTSIAGVILES
jgi:hypothetical protein